MNKEMARIYNNIGALNFFTANYNEALKYYQLSLAIELEEKNSLGIAQSYENIGIIYKKFGEFKKAEDYYLDAYEKYKELKQTKSISNVLVNLGSLQLAENKTNNAIRYFNEALSVQYANHDNTGIVFTKNNLGDAWFNLNNYSKATTYYLESLELAKEIGLNEQIRYSYQSLSNVYTKNKDYKNALEFYKLYSALNDSIFNDSKSKQFYELQTKYESETKQLKIEQQEERHLQDKNLIQISLSAFVLLLTLSIILLIFYFKKQNAYKFLVRLNIELAQKEAAEYIFAHQKSATEKYSGSTLNAETKEQLLTSINTLLENKAIYLNANLIIDDFAAELKTNKKYISQVINEEFSTNFNNLINKYRIKEARRLLLSEESKKLSLQGIAENCGFNNRATFNAAFKKFTGVTPSFYMNSNKE
jgi:AraC-like DNA-binding protein/Flp pilus assembly protein TadD